MGEFTLNDLIVLQEANRKKPKKIKVVKQFGQKVIVEITDPRYVVRPKTAGQGSSSLGFAKGEVFGQNLEDQ